jgi:cobalt-zinc-cadmium efflux system outer membrane protein
LPPPPAVAAIPADAPPGETLIELAVQQRPDLAAQQSRIEADQSALALACKEYYPDLAVAAKYDTFMPPEMRSQVGLSVNVPLYRQRRHAAVEEASARLRQHQQELQRMVDEAGFEVQSAGQRLAERREVAGLYKDKILPAAKANVESARIKNTNAQLDFLRLIEAQRQYQMQQDRYYMALADCHRIAAELERAVGGRIALR